VDFYGQAQMTFKSTSYITAISAETVKEAETTNFASVPLPHNSACHFYYSVFKGWVDGHGWRPGTYFQGCT